MWQPWSGVRNLNFITIDNVLCAFRTSSDREDQQNNSTKIIQPKIRVALNLLTCTHGTLVLVQEIIDPPSERGFQGERWFTYLRDLSTSLEDFIQRSPITKVALHKLVSNTTVAGPDDVQAALDGAVPVGVPRHASGSRPLEVGKRGRVQEEPRQVVFFP